MKKKLIVSFTALVISFVKDEISAEEVKNADLIIFGCARQHLFNNNDDNAVPMEVSWCNEKRDSSYTEQTPNNKIDMKVLKKWKQLKEIILNLDVDGKVKWQYGGFEGYSDMIEKLSSEYNTFYRGTWS